jgi:hypothetical protein
MTLPAMRAIALVSTVNLTGTVPGGRPAIWTGPGIATGIASGLARRPSGPQRGATHPQQTRPMMSVEATNDPPRRLTTRGASAAGDVVAAVVAAAGGVTATTSTPVVPWPVTMPQPHDRRTRTTSRKTSGIPTCP